MPSIHDQLENCTNESLLSAVNVLLLLWYQPTCNILHVLDNNGGSSTLDELKREEIYILTDTLENDLQLLNHANLISYSNDKYQLNNLIILKLLENVKLFRQYAKKPDEKELLKQIKYMLKIKEKLPF